MATLAEGSGECGNQPVEVEECAKIRGLSDFDIVMLISGIHDHGWPMTRVALALMPPASEEDFRRRQKQLASMSVVFRPG